MKLRELKKGEYFRIVKKSGEVSKQTYIKDDYCRGEKKFYILLDTDVWGAGRLVKGDQEVTTEFVY